MYTQNMSIKMSKQRNKNFILHLNNRRIIQIKGSDRTLFINQISSQKISNSFFNDQEALILTSKGKIKNHLRIINNDKNMLLIVLNIEHRNLILYLKKMTFRLNVKIENISNSYTIIAANNLVKDLMKKYIFWKDPWPKIKDGGCSYIADEEAILYQKNKWKIIEYIVPKKDLKNILSNNKNIILKYSKFESYRIAAYRPQITDVDDRSIPHEFDWLRTAVHLKKGCYPGQETVSKVYNFGFPPRRLTFLNIHCRCNTNCKDNHLPLPRSSIRALNDSKNIIVGNITSCIYHDTFGIIALALIKRNVSPNSFLSIFNSCLNIDKKQKKQNENINLQIATQTLIVSPKKRYNKRIMEFRSLKKNN